MTYYPDIQSATKMDERSSCGGKVKYQYQVTAESVAFRLTQTKREPYEAYKCRHCESWHIGHPKFWKWRAGKRGG